MTNVKKIKIGTDIYSVKNDVEMYGNELGSIYQGTSEIKMRSRTYNNGKINKRTYYKVLMHEIVHGIDYNVMFTVPLKDDDGENIENCIDLISIYIVKNLENIIKNRENQFVHFLEYVEMCESNMVRLYLLYCEILNLIDDNEKLINEFLKVFK